MRITIISRKPFGSCLALSKRELPDNSSSKLNMHERCMESFTKKERKKLFADFVQRIISLNSRSRLYTFLITDRVSLSAALRCNRGAMTFMRMLYAASLRSLYLHASLCLYLRSRRLASPHGNRHSRSLPAGSTAVHNGTR